MRTHSPLVVIGDSLLDRDLSGRSTRMCPDEPSAPVIDLDSAVSRPGGAALAALMSAKDGVPTTLVTPLATDSEGRQLRDRLEEASVTVVALGHCGPTRVKTRMLVRKPSDVPLSDTREGSASRCIARVDSGGPGNPVGTIAPRLETALTGATGILLSCYGGGVSEHREIRELLAEWLLTDRPLVWDPHPRGAAPIPGCRLLTPNLAEARAHTGLPDSSAHEVGARLLEEWAACAVAVTTGADGAWLVSGTEDHHVPCTSTCGSDTCGAGDRFAVAAAAALADGCDPLTATREAVEAASGFVTAGGVSALSDGLHSPPHRPTIVATGGCFDVFHAGHLQLLEQARSLGDPLVVLVNSDESVRRLKGASRPVHRLEDRVRVLRGLACVDSVTVFDEDDPRPALSRIRPDIWVKGGDYTVDALPESDVVRSWGGRVVILPTLAGRRRAAVLHTLNGGPR